MPQQLQERLDVEDDVQRQARIRMPSHSTVFHWLTHPLFPSVHWENLLQKTNKSTASNDSPSGPSSSSQLPSTFDFGVRDTHTIQPPTERKRCLSLIYVDNKNKNNYNYVYAFFIHYYYQYSNEYKPFCPKWRPLTPTLCEEHNKLPNPSTLNIWTHPKPANTLKWLVSWSSHLHICLLRQ